MLAELCPVVIDINYRYWEYHWEQTHKDSHNKGKSTPAAFNTFTPAKCTPSASAPKSNNNNFQKFFNSTSITTIPSVLDKDSKLLLAKWKWYLDDKLCIFCRAAGHMAKNCPKPSSSAAKEQAAIITSTPIALSKNLSSTVNLKK